MFVYKGCGIYVNIYVVYVCVCVWALHHMSVQIRLYMYIVAMQML